MNIGIFTNNYRPLPTGLATSIDAFADFFRGRGHRVVVFAPRYRGPASPEADVVRVPAVGAPTATPYALPLPGAGGVGRRADEAGLDLVHVQHPFLLGVAGARVARRRGLPLVFTYHTRYECYGHYAPGPASLAGALARWRSLAFANRADLVVAPAPSLAALLRGRGVRRPVAVVPTGVPVPPESRWSRARARRRLGLGNEGPVLLYLGRLAREKNPLLVLEAFGRIRRRFPDACLLLVGFGGERRRLESRAAALGIGRQVLFTGAVPHRTTALYHRAADLFLFPSVTETQGLVVLEALACGTPVVAVRSPAAVDALGEEGGRLVEPGADAMAEAAVDLLADPPARADLEERGRARAREFSPERSGEMLLALYRRLVEGGTGA